jgi:hypothetical protein
MLSLRGWDANDFDVLLILMLLGGVPAWPHSSNWGYRPSGSIGTLLLVFIVLVLLGVI